MGTSGLYCDVCILGDCWNWKQRLLQADACRCIRSHSSSLFAGADIAPGGYVGEYTGVVSEDGSSNPACGRARNDGYRMRYPGIGAGGCSGLDLISATISHVFFSCASARPPTHCFAVHMHLFIPSLFLIVLVLMLGIESLLPNFRAVSVGAGDRQCHPLRQPQ